MNSDYLILQKYEQWNHHCSLRINSHRLLETNMTTRLNFGVFLIIFWVFFSHKHTI